MTSTAWPVASLLLLVLVQISLMERTALTVLLNLHRPWPGKLQVRTGASCWPWGQPGWQQRHRESRRSPLCSGGHWWDIPLQLPHRISADFSLGCKGT